MSEESKPAAEPGKAKRSRISQADIPAISLEKALRVPRAIAENYASHPTRPFDVAAALMVQPSSGGFRVECGAAIGYGLTEGGPNAPEISLTALGARVVTPTEVDDDTRALREAALKPTVANQFYSKYNGSPLPPKSIAENVLATFAVPRDRTGDVYDLLIENARYVGLLKSIKDKEYIDIAGPSNGGVPGGPVTSAAVGEGTSASSPSAIDDGLYTGGEEEFEDVVDAPPQSISGREPSKNAIFVGHGGNRKPMEQLVKILNEYGIPHKEAVDSANTARPIPLKVAETMRECGAAILVFTADKEYFDAEGNSVWRPSENVSHELGAASVLYGERIVIFKERGIDLPSNFSSIGYIEFEKDKLSDKGIELFRELVSMKILNFSIG
ncbi:MAG: nucleotide-binding protein [Cellulomonas sp.]|uniref:TIR domain-containing protein n=1 Tax=Cellulomonas sp. TaxID=40001 RepID=UPI0019FD1734|nr:TIR domain-containing protein [Cellulomonas sp.]MBF0686717.1 nucleotide-binding protein [Cellulomonas sp.]